MLEWKIGDCKDLMSEMEPDSVDLVVTDPPYGISMMNMGWDKVVPPVALWKEALRVLKPGAFAFIMSAPRQDVLAHNLVNLSDAGFETGFTSIYWVYPSGFPKASNIGKMVDKRLGAEREVIGINPNGFAATKTGDICNAGGTKIAHPPLTIPTTPQAKSLDGSYGGFQPKPAVEVIMCVMKPLSESTYVDQALANGKGITWLDDGRIPYQSDDDIKNATPFSPDNIKTGIFGNLKNRTDARPNTQGRFPANLLVCDDALNTGEQHRGGITNYQASSIFNNELDREKRNVWIEDSGSFSRYFDLDAWFDTKYLPKEARKTFPFLITPKASKSEKGNVDIDNTDKYNGKFPCSKADKNKNKHPTVKPVKLFAWLMTIGSRKGDLVLDPFLGSGTALEAGYLTGRDIIGFELDPQWERLYEARAHTYQGSLEDWV